ncbi:hypothetical protein ACFO4O_06690 [Glaciecola siphonariae]|uniref:Uncharacterized protein n=1 Tax=Glaciecola siphonariae TaxID=521012 RepID=A0ABV9LV53_9ALTE
MAIARAQAAALQAMGIDIYYAYQEESERPALAQKPWFESLIELLGITEHDCQFSDSLPISFDPINKKLVLPFTIENEDAVLKREIWQHIQADVPQ